MGGRRELLKASVALATVGTAGCIRGLLGRPEHRLWFVRLNHNGWQRLPVDVRVRRDGEGVYEHGHDVPPNVRDEDIDQTATFVGGMQNVVFIEPQWETSAARFEVAYRAGERESWKYANLGEVQVENVAVTLDSWDSGVAGARFHRFDSESQAQEVLAHVEAEIDEYGTGREGEE